MAVIEALPTPEIVRSFKGTLDYYYWRGLYVVRSWPRKPTMPRSPAVQATASAFGAIIRAVPRTDARIVAAAREQTRNTEWTWRDETVAGLYGTLFTDPEEEEQDVVLLSRRLFSDQVRTSFSVNSLTYTWTTVLFLAWPENMPTPSAFQIHIEGGSNQGGQTVTFQLVDLDNGQITISAAGDDLTIPFTKTTYNTPYIPVVNPPAAAGNLIGLQFKGSNSSVDFQATYVDVEFFA